MILQSIIEYNRCHSFTTLPQTKILETLFFFYLGLSIHLVLYGALIGQNYILFTPGHKINFCGFCQELVDMAVTTQFQSKWFQQQFSCARPWRKLVIGTKVSQTGKNQCSLVLLHVTNVSYNLDSLNVLTRAYTCLLPVPQFANLQFKCATHKQQRV